MIREQLSGTVSVPFLRDVMLATSEPVGFSARFRDLTVSSGMCQAAGARWLTGRVGVDRCLLPRGGGIERTARSGSELSAVVHVKPLDIGWEVRRHGERSASSQHNTRSSAVRLGRQLAVESKSELVIFEIDGTMTKEQFADD